MLNLVQKSEHWKKLEWRNTRPDHIPADHVPVAELEKWTFPDAGVDANS